MDDTILSISDRGQITIPHKMRNNMFFKHLVCTFEDGAIVLRPFQNKDDFLLELENAEKDWERNGGMTIADMKKKHGLK